MKRLLLALLLLSGCVSQPKKKTPVEEKKPPVEEEQPKEYIQKGCP